MRRPLCVRSLATRLTALVAAAACWLGTSPARATASDPVRFGIPHQGRLLSRNDTPVDGVRGMTFALYRSATGGTAVWSQVQNVDVANGYYAVLLGDPDDAAAPALTEGLFDGPLFLGITVFPDSELSPRLPIGIAPYAVRARLADKVEGGTITGATITGGQVSGATLQDVTVSGGSVSGVTVQASRVEASQVVVNGETVTANGVRKDGDEMTGPLTAPRFVSTTTDAAPFTVASNARVDRLNAELLDGNPASAFVRADSFDPEALTSRDEVYAIDLTNLVNGGHFENWFNGNAEAPNWWSGFGSWSIGFGFLQRVAAGYDGAALAIVDNDTSNRVRARQVAVPVAGPAQADQDYTLSVRIRRTAGTAPAELCVRDTTASQTCASAAATSEWALFSVTHHSSAAPETLEAILGSPVDPAATATFQFDSAMLVKGKRAVDFRRSPADFNPSGLIGFFPATCPSGWIEYTAARGRTIVGTPAGGSAAGTVGNALGDLGTRTIVDVPAHSHVVDPPSTLSVAVADHTHLVDPPNQNSAVGGAHNHVIDAPISSTDVGGAHQHFIDPPPSNSSLSGSHSHGIRTYQNDYGATFDATGRPSWYADGGVLATTHFTELGGDHGHAFDIPGFYSDADGAHAHSIKIPAFSSNVDGSHSHAVNLAPFTSNPSGAHAHQVDVAAFPSASTGSTTVDVTMPYIQLTACRAL